MFPLRRILRPAAAAASAAASAAPAAALHPHARPIARLAAPLAAVAAARPHWQPRRCLSEAAGEAASPAGAERFAFETETKRVLEIVINSLYSDREVFLRELVSNASDALEKARHDALESGADPGALEVRVDTDAEKRTLTVTDKGIGMTREELVSNLGTIAKSGTKAFLEKLKAEGSKPGTELIGQFGVGFYSSFVVSDRVEVFTKSAADPPSPVLRWESEGDGAFTVREATLEEAEGLDRGTRIVMHLKPDAVEFAAQATVERILQKYSSFVSHPIVLNGSRANEHAAIWSKQPKEVTDEEHHAFYKYVAKAYDMPVYRMHFVADAPIAVQALLYFPALNKERAMERIEAGTQLYSRRVLISNSAKVLPDWLRFISGVVDSEDLPLNISRETLQDSRPVHKLRAVLTKRVLKLLKDEAKKDAVKYLEWFGTFGSYLKEGVCMDTDHKDALADLLRFDSTAEGGDGTGCSLKDYVGRMKEGQDTIYYLQASSREAANASPYLESLRAKGYECLLVYAPVDEFVMGHLAQYDGKRLQTAEHAVVEVDTPEGGEGLSEEALEGLCAWMKETLGDMKIKEVKGTNRLVDSPAVLANHELEAMKRWRMVATQAAQGTKDANLLAELADAQATLEINPRHELVMQLQAARESGEEPKVELAKMVVEQLYDNARLAAGSINDPRLMVTRLNQLLSKALRSQE